MTAIEFRELWQPGEFDKWIEFDANEIDSSQLTGFSKDFLKGGFPDSAAPFLSFGWSSYKGKFCSISDCYPSYEENKRHKDFWILGIDGGGNPICFDVANNDNIVWLDHEQGFQIIDTLNTNIAELAQCLLAYKNFVKKMQDENGGRGFFDDNINENQWSGLVDDFKAINSNIFKRSGFWRGEVSALKPK